MRALTVLLAALSATAFAEPDVLSVDTSSVFRETSPLLWGVFFEEINHSGDGGLYAEMVRNRGFEDNTVPADCTEDAEAFISATGFRLPKGQQAVPLSGWRLVAEGAEARAVADTGTPLNPASPTSLRLDVTKMDPSGRAGVANGGFWGMSFKKGASYRLSLHARGADMPLTAALTSGDGAKCYAKADLGTAGASWGRFEAVLTASETDTRGALLLTTSRAGSLSLDLVSLFPVDTFKGRNNGLRTDLAERIANLKPAFMRFPGGCIVEGFTPESAWDWKETVGDPVLRPGRQNLWEYRATDGLGYHEFLQFCEDLGMAPILVVNCGMTCQGRNPIYQPLDAVDRYVRDALDAVEYANGGPETRWGAERARNGHPEPFGLRHITIGNENGGPEYRERYDLFARVFRERYPDIRLISNSPVPESPTDYEEHHYYMTPQWFAANADKYDGYDRSLPKVFVSEYAANTAAGKGNLEAAVGEAAFMIGLENNSDVVSMAAYAPLFCHEEDRKWPVNLIVFDNHRVYGTPSYHVQKLFAENRPDDLYPVDYPRGGARVSLSAGGVGVGTWETRAEFKDLEVAPADGSTASWRPGADGGGWRFLDGEWSSRGAAVSQGDLGVNRLALAGDAGWTDYTLRLKARKLGGKEGFLILFRATDAGNWHWANLGGWGNREHGLESCIQGSRCGGGPRVPGTIETGRWYDIQVEVKGDRVRVALDGAPLLDGALPSLRTPGITANAGRDRKTGEHIVKVANFLDRDWAATVTLGGVSGPVSGTVTRVWAPSRTAENSLDQPDAVVPETAPARHDGGSFTQTFPACSLTVLRLHGEAAAK